ncbi:MAG: histidine phosphatase family protein [Bacteroidales bacterium]|nr:histidine phosphatase family protein [Bacteroidales bacterium]
MTCIVQHIQSLSSNARAAILIRHSERNKIPRGEFGTHYMLTENGVRMAEEFGTKLSDFRIVKIYTSPILRCIQTASLLKKGIGKPLEIISDHNLGDPGFHISNAEKAGKYYLSYGAKGVFEKYIVGEKLDGLATVNYLKTTAMDWLKSQVTESGITIFVTHDALIANFAYANGIKTYSRENWVEFLDGIVLKF